MTEGTLPTLYRPCVGMMVVNLEGLVLVGQRFDSVVEAWQMPQGGVDEGEDIREAALRELREEVGTDAVNIIAETHDWLHYDLPEHLIARLWNGQFRGQKQRWFLMQLEDTSRINIATYHPEFKAVDWVSVEALTTLVVPFKKVLYQEVIARFTPDLRALGAVV
jgi:putative (di)nucleoside polyphosphate hydrolase